MKVSKKYFVAVTLLVALIILLKYQSSWEEGEVSQGFIDNINAQSENLEVELQPLIERNKKLNQRHTDESNSLP